MPLIEHQSYEHIEHDILQFLEIHGSLLLLVPVRFSALSARLAILALRRLLLCSLYISLSLNYMRLELVNEFNLDETGTSPRLTVFLEN